MATLPSARTPRVVLDRVWPMIDGGRYPVKRVIGDLLRVEAHLLIDGHDHLAGVLRWRPRGAERFAETPLEAAGNDVYSAGFALPSLGRWEYTVEAWLDEFSTYRWGLGRKRDAKVELGGELLDGARLVSEAAARAGQDKERLSAIARALGDSSSGEEARVALALSEELEALMRRHPDRSHAVKGPILEVVVDPAYARFSSWYELFPRSLGKGGKHGTLRDVEAHLAYVKRLGFDVLYLPPIHPIGVQHRKGRNNALTAAPGEPGSPWAIGGADGGHKDVHPELGTVEDLVRLAKTARAQGIELALDIAFQASPDHPYVAAHPDWFVRRADGTLRYAENPPKKYQDVHPFDFEGPTWQALWTELRSVFEVWIERGVRVFRVDNPHTKPLPFWEWCIGTIKDRNPDVIFLAEAFTRPKLMAGLAKVGFSQSYSYFTWRTTASELQRYFEELTSTELAELMRPNLWPNTPDILPEHLQHGGRPMFVARLVLAATLGANYGIYGPAFELMDAAPLRAGGEEYLDSEKYQLRSWELDAPHSLAPLIAVVNRIRRQEAALQHDRGLRFHRCDNPAIVAYSKRAGDEVVLVAVNLDPSHRHAGWVDLDLDALGLPHDRGFQVHELIGQARYQWQGARNYVELDPAMPAQVFRVRTLVRREDSFEYFL